MEEISGNKIQEFHFKKHFDRWHLYVSAILLFAYIAVRAAVLSFTWDEAYSYFEFVRDPSWLPRDFNYMAANNHLLNTWLMKICLFFFGDGEFALRLPNVLAGGIYFFIAARLCSAFFPKDKFLSFTSFLLLTLNPYLLDFFSLARGYGLSIALLLCGIYFAFRFIHENYRLRHALLAEFFFILAMSANLVMVHVLLAAMVILPCFRFGGEKEKRFRDVLLLLCVPLVVTAAFLPYFLKLKDAGAFFLGSEATSPLATFASLGDATAYSSALPGFISPLLVRLFYAIPAGAVLVLFIGRKRKFADKKVTVLTFFFTLLLVVFSGPVLQHYLMKSNFISGRVALFYLPLLALVLIAQFSFFQNLYKKILPGIFSLAFLLLFIFTFNFHHVYDWREQADVKSAMCMLSWEKKIMPQGFFTHGIGTDLSSELPVNYYEMKFDMLNFSNTLRDESGNSCDYYYLPAADTTRFPDHRTIHFFPATNTCLFCVAPAQSPEIIADTKFDFDQLPPDPLVISDPRFSGGHGTFANEISPASRKTTLAVTDTANKNLVLSLRCRLYPDSPNTTCLLVLNFDGDNDSLLDWQGIHVSEITDHSGEWITAGLNRQIPQGTKKIYFYLWNRDNNTVLMDDVEMRVLRFPM